MLASPVVAGAPSIALLWFRLDKLKGEYFRMVFAVFRTCLKIKFAKSCAMSAESRSVGGFAKTSSEEIFLRRLWPNNAAMAAMGSVAN